MPGALRRIAEKIGRKFGGFSAVHLVGWAVLAVLSFLQAPGRTAADTKFDLTANPAGFLQQATQAYTDTFTLGQIQNQAYGYLFPQGLFFLLTDPLPDWVAQRLWWAIVMGVAFSGTVEVARRVGMGVWGASISGVLYTLSPRIMTTLTAISSEAWPVALVPWTLVPLLGGRVTWRDVAASVVPVALMGAVNATATMMACLPAFLLLVWRLAWRELGVWLAGVAAVSAWWIGPLLVLGRYSPPFTDFIESSYVTSRWLNFAEMLRGTTSWAPFVDTERVAGHLLVAEPVFVLATATIAALGVVGLALTEERAVPWRGYWVLLLCVGIAVMGAAHGPFDTYWRDAFDGALAPFRNVHKLDPLIRLPLVVGAGHAITRAAASARHRGPALVAVTLAAVVAIAPAWSLRLAPQGTWTAVSADWQAAAAFLEREAAGTRTLVAPQASFARQTWGWTRDEPIQALTDVPFAVRDAIPLVDPEAIRGLDGQLAALDPSALRAIGVGAVVVRRDLEPGWGAEVPQLSSDFGQPEAEFGDLSVYLLDPARGMMIAPSSSLTTVAGGGEVLPLLDRELGYAPRLLVGGENPQADIITDTPALLKRNYGTLVGPTSAHLPVVGAEQLPQMLDEGGDVRNREQDYPSLGRRVAVAETGFIRASSSAADATAFGGADPSASVTSAVDGLAETIWRPAPGDAQPWLVLIADEGTQDITITSDADTTVLVDGQPLDLTADTPATVPVDNPHIGIELREPVGIREIDAGVHRIVEVTGTGDMYFFQRLFPPTSVIQRAFTTTDGTFELSAPSLIDGTPHSPGTIHLPAGRHEIVTDAETVSLTRLDAAHTGVDAAQPGLSASQPDVGAARPSAASWQPFDGTVQASDTERLILTTRAFNSGLRGTVSGDTPVDLEPVRIDSGMQAFRLPAGTSGHFEMSFAGTDFFRNSLLLGGVFSLAALGVSVAAAFQRPRGQSASTPDFPQWARRDIVTCAGFAAVILTAGFPGLLAWTATWLIRRFTLIPAWVLGGGAAAILGLWLARAPWPSANYAGDSAAVAVAGCVVIACLALASRTTGPDSRSSREPVAPHPAPSP